MEVPIRSLTAAQIPKAFWALGSDTYAGTKRPIAQIMNFARNFDAAVITGVGLYIHGPNVSGKTFLATLALKCILAQRKQNAIYASVAVLMNEYFDKERNWDHLCKTDCLCLDNFSEFPHEGQRQLVDYLLHDRQDQGLPTILVCALSIPELQSVHGNSVHSLVDAHMIEVKATLSPMDVRRMRKSAKSQFTPPL